MPEQVVRIVQDGTTVGEFDIGPHAKVGKITEEKTTHHEGTKDEVKVTSAYVVEVTGGEPDVNVGPVKVRPGAEVLTEGISEIGNQSETSNLTRNRTVSTKTAKATGDASKVKSKK